MILLKYKAKRSDNHKWAYGFLARVQASGVNHWELVTDSNKSFAIIEETACPTFKNESTFGEDIYLGDLVRGLYQYDHGMDATIITGEVVSHEDADSGIRLVVQYTYGYASIRYAELSDIAMLQVMGNKWDAKYPEK